LHTGDFNFTFTSCTECDQRTRRFHVGYDLVRRKEFLSLETGSIKLIIGTYCTRGKLHYTAILVGERTSLTTVRRIGGFQLQILAELLAEDEEGE